MTSVLTTKFTCDHKGNWTEVPVILTRSGNGWVESAPPTLPIVRKEAA
jgi:hypothetical protein